MNYNLKLRQLLIDYLVSLGYVSSGALNASISFNLKITPNGKVDLGLRANNYILYLDKGNLLDNFLSQAQVKNTIAEFITSELLKF